MSRIENSPCDPKLLSPLALAFVGDGVYDLFVRERLVCEANRPVKKLNEEKVSIVRCSSQAKLVEKLMPILTEEELDVLKEAEMLIHSISRKMQHRQIIIQPQLWKLY